MMKLSELEGLLAVYNNPSTPPGLSDRLFEQARAAQALEVALIENAEELIAMARRWLKVRHYLHIDNYGNTGVCYAMCVDGKRLEDEAYRALHAFAHGVITVENVIDALEKT